MQALTGQTTHQFIERSDIFTDFIGPMLLGIGFLTLVFLGLGLFFAKIVWGSGGERLKQARAESLQLSGRANEILEDQNLILNKLKKSSAVFKADLAFRDNKINKLQGDFQKIQNDLNARIESESNLTGLLRARDREVERLSEELSQFEGIEQQIAEKDEEIRILREDVAAKEGVYARLGELEGILSERDEEFESFQQEHHGLIERFNQVSADFEDKNNAFAALEQNLADGSGALEKVSSLEDLLKNRDEDIDRLRNDRDQLKSDLESTIRNREAKIMELEDILGEKEGVIDALQSESPSAEAIEEYENIIAERDLEIEELKHSHGTNGKLQEEFDELADQLRQRDSEIQNIKKQYHDAKQQREEKFHEIKSELDTRDAEIKSLRVLQSTTDKLKARVSELEWMLGERDGDLNNLRSEKIRLENLPSKIQDLERTLGDRDREIESFRNDRGSKEKLRSRLKDLEHIVSERDIDLDRLEQENSDLSRRLKSTESNTQRIRIERETDDGLHSRIRDLEKQLSDRNGSSKTSGASLVRVERSSGDDLYERLRDLERMVSDRDRETRASRNSEKTEYRFTMGNGAATFLEADDTIEFEGKTYRAEELYYVLRDRGQG